MTQPGTRFLAFMLTVVVLTSGVALWAQEGERPARGERGERGQRNQQRDPEQMRQRMEQMRAAMSERLREQLGASAEEWQVLEPMIENVQTIQREGGMGMPMMGRGRRGGPGGPQARGDGEARELPPVVQATRALQETVQNENATEAELQEKVKALRDARAAHQARLTEAREALRSALTPRQEAALIVNGVLD